MGFKLLLNSALKGQGGGGRTASCQTAKAKEMPIASLTYDAWNCSGLAEWLQIC
jgi:hypothetical protein